MKKNPWTTLLVLLVVFGSLFVILVGTSVYHFMGEPGAKVTAKNSILHLELNGIIIDSKKFLKQLVKYRKNDHIKAVVVEVNSPGGVVGPSQEIYEELRKVREEFKKPVVVVSSGLLASGAYYVAVAGDKILVQPGTMVGSIGVIMEFVNLEKLYDWAKVGRYSITTGKYKDSGAEYRPMREDERALFQDMINDVWNQFKDAVADGRNLEMDQVEKYADGRVITGSQAVQLGFADGFGTLEDAYETAADLANLDDYEVFDPPKKRPGIFDLIAVEDEEMSGQFGRQIDGVMKKIFRTELANKPLFLMPGAIE
ncbi:MAG: multidrug transporter [Oligoflexia bacterium]|nr:MAG: multidrug transporter [Oligoflexia bacterium]